MDPFASAGPLLEHHPDGVKAPFSLPPPVAYVYLALMVGIVPTALAAAGVGLALRSTKQVLVAAVVGAVGFAMPILPLLIMGGEGANFGLFFLVMRMISVALGFALYKVAVPTFRGHAMLRGDALPLMWLIGPAFAFILLVPRTISFAAEAPILALLSLVAS